MRVAFDRLSLNQSERRQGQLSCKVVPNSRSTILEESSPAKPKPNETEWDPSRDVCATERHEYGTAEKGLRNRTAKVKSLTLVYLSSQGFKDEIRFSNRVLAHAIRPVHSR